MSRPSTVDVTALFLAKELPEAAFNTKSYGTLYLVFGHIWFSATAIPDACRTLGLPRRHDAPRRGDMRLDAADWRRPRARAWPCPALIVGEACLAPRSFPCRAHQPRRQQ